MSAIWEMLRLFVVQVFVVPVQGGRIRDVAWPPGLRPIVLLAVVGFAIAVCLVLGAEWIRSTVALTQSSSSTPPLPRAALWSITGLAALAISLAQTGALHVRAWLRWTMTAFTVLVMLAVTLSDSTWIARLYAMLASAAIIVLVAVRGRRAFTWWEFCVVSGAVFTTFAISIATMATYSLPLGYDLYPALLILVLMILGQLAVPAATAAGASVAEITVSSAAWVSDAIRRGLGIVSVSVVLVGVIAWRLGDVVRVSISLLSHPVEWAVDLLSAGSFIAAIAASWWALGALRRTRSHLLIGDFTSSMARVSLPISLFLTLAIPVVVVVLPFVIFASFTGQAWMTQLSYSLVAAASGVVPTGVAMASTALTLIVLAVLHARRGRTATPELFVAVGIAIGAIAAGLLLGVRIHWSPDALALVATIIPIGLLVWILVARRATVNRLSAITGALLIAALFTHRDFVADPIATLTNSTAAAVVVVGLVWGFLSGNAVASENSSGYPRPARVLLVLANHVFVVTVLAFTLLARDPDIGLNVANSMEIGASTFGDALIACSAVAAFVACVRDREIV